MNTVQELDVAKFKGTQYEMFRNIENKFEEMDCVRAIYGDSDIPGSITVVNSALSGDKPNQVLRGIDGYAY